MATLYLMCGLPCAGKTTYAKRLEEERSALRLTPDEWHIALFGQDAAGPEHDERHDKIEATLWKLAVQVLRLDRDVILDFGFWSRAERDAFRSRAYRLNVKVEVHFLQAPEDDLLRRLRLRNKTGSDGTFYVTEAQLSSWMKLFEPPTRVEPHCRFVEI